MPVVREPLVADKTRVIGFIRPDDTRKLAWIMLGALPTLIGALLVGYAYGRIDVADPIGLYADARGYESSQAEPSEPSEADEPAYALQHPRERGSASTGVAVALFTLGMILVATGPIIAIVLLRQLWFRDEWVLLRDDAIVMQTFDEDRTVPWYDMERVVFSGEEGVVTFLMKEGDRVVLPPRFAGRDPKDTAERLETMRRKACWSLL